MRLPRPTRTGSRVVAVDVARGVALLGMMVAHLTPFGDGETPALGHLLAGGRAAPLFALLAGVSLTLVHRLDPQRTGTVRATVVRALLLFVVGLWLGSLEDVPVFVILCVYAVLVVAALPFRRMPTPWLLAVAVAWAVIGPVVLMLLRRHVDVVEAADPEWTDLAHPVDLVVQLTVWGAYPALAWFAYVLAGMLVGRLDLRDTRVAVGLLVAGGGLVAVTVGVVAATVRLGAFPELAGAGVLDHLALTYPPPSDEWRFLLILGQHTSTPVNVVSAIGSALVVVGLSALLVRIGGRLGASALAPVRAAGAMTLTLYVAHVCWSTWSDLLLEEPAWSVWWLQAGTFLVAATAWMLVLPRGPLEQVIRWVSLLATRWPRHEKSAPEGA